MTIKFNPKANQNKAPFALPSLPYEHTALEPYISAKTFEFHHGKHHQAYINKLNELIAGTELEHKNLEEIIHATHKDDKKAAIFNNAAQVWNHTFYWHCMKKNGGGEPTGKIAELINKDFGSFEQFKSSLKEAGATQFGSGWAWLVLENNSLKITKTGNADLPIIRNQMPLLTIDVWEHAYYLDYQNKRPDYLTIFIDHLVNWDFVNKNLELYTS